MAYILFERQPGAAQSFHNFRLSSMIAEKSGGDREAAEKLLSLVYYRSIQVAAKSDPKKIVPVLPPAGNGLWSWNRSFEIVCDLATQWVDDEIPVMVPEGADIFIGTDFADLPEVQKEQDIMAMLDALEFDFDNAGPGAEKSPEEMSNWSDSLGLAVDTAFASGDSTSGIAMQELAEQADEDEDDDIREIVESVGSNTFSKWLTKTMKSRGLSSASLAEQSNMLSTTVIRLAKGIIMVPTKSCICAIGIALGLNREQFDEMLAMAGYLLSPNVPRDMIVAYYIEKKERNVAKVNKTLFLNKIPTLGAHKVMPK